MDWSSKSSELAILLVGQIFMQPVASKMGVCYLHIVCIYIYIYIGHEWHCLQRSLRKGDPFQILTQSQRGSSLNRIGDALNSALSGSLIEKIHWQCAGCRISTFVMPSSRTTRPSRELRSGSGGKNGLDDEPHPPSMSTFSSTFPM